MRLSLGYSIQRKQIFKNRYFPFVDCEFEGRTYMTYHNAENVAHQWWGPNCTKRWNGTEWEETYQKEKRAQSMLRRYYLESNKSYEEVTKRT